MSWTVYRVLDADGQCLYVGMTQNIENRTRQHRRDLYFGDRVAEVEAVSRHDSKDEAHAAEVVLIGHERTPFNLHHNPHGGSGRRPPRNLQDVPA